MKTSRARRVVLAYTAGIMIAALFLWKYVLSAQGTPFLDFPSYWVGAVAAFDLGVSPYGEGFVAVRERILEQYAHPFIYPPASRASAAPASRVSRRCSCPPCSSPRSAGCTTWSWPFPPPGCLVARAVAGNSMRLGAIAALAGLVLLQNPFEEVFGKSGKLALTAVTLMLLATLLGIIAGEERDVSTRSRAET